MAKITIRFESASALSEGPEEISYEVDEAHAPDFVAAVAAHPVHGKVEEIVQADTGLRDLEGNPILGPAKVFRAATFREGLQSWARLNVRDPILGAVNTYRVEKAKAIALAALRVDPIEPKN
jgi:hypothetical protein